ncbi:hypothetical protein [Delftia lacustris]|uniref:Uncharacterized protein n=1 Tax=Delftia lacustris TaxID=558537 RepID=A0A1H3SY91_9BURK|nr:hypothetical protein [Delftia lacustris]SDZ42996.1 hypothetical protein SAMN05421547_1245 [Delftia lacustris]
MSNFSNYALSCIKNFPAATALVVSLNATAFDDVSLKASGQLGPVRSLIAMNDGISVIYENGQRQIFRNVDHPKNGSPVTYIYEGEDVELNAYVVSVWRVGKQMVLVSKSTGAFVEVGSHRSVSPDGRMVFSSDCWEVGCYYQLNNWPSGKRLVFSKKVGKKGDFNIRESIDMGQVRWVGGESVRFQVTCSGGSAAEVFLSLKSPSFLLKPLDPCV